METPLSTEEKIDYIYSTLKKNERKAAISGILKWGFRIFMLGYIYYFITVGLPVMIDSFIPQIPDLPSAQGINTDDLKETLNNFLK